MASMVPAASWGEEVQRKVLVSSLYNQWQDMWEEHKAAQGRFQLDIRRNFFSRRLVKHWDRLPSRVVDVPCQLVFNSI